MVSTACSISASLSEGSPAFGGIAPEALPSTILLDREHRVAIRLFGAVTMADLVPFLDQLSSETE